MNLTLLLRKSCDVHMTLFEICVQQNWVGRTDKPCTQIYLLKNCKLQAFATTNGNIEKINYFRHSSSYITYMYIDFQQIGLVDQSKPCTQIYMQKNRKLHKSATNNSNFEKN